MIALSAVATGAYGQTVSKAEYDKLKSEYDQIVTDRNNILSQTRTLISYKNRVEDMEALVKSAQAEKAQVEEKLKAALQENQKLLAGTSDEKVLLEQKISSLNAAIKQLEKQREELKAEFEKREVEFKVVPETKRQLTQALNEKKELLRSTSQLEAKVRRLEQDRLDKDAQIEIYRRQVKDFKVRYEKSLIKNRKLEQKAEQLPAKFAELARENKVLIKETALMHYNLGVFYTKNKEYQRAIAEFEKTIDLNPDDPYAHYNLGYIYAEYVLNRPKAMEHFRKFLSLVKSDDKDVDWVKKYILTWQTWDAKKPVE